MANFSSTYPATRPVFMADFANGGKIDPRATFSRSSTASVFDGAKHLSSENLIAYSNPVTSQWTETNTAITVNALAAPDGTTTASNVLETAATGYHETRETFACTNAVSHTATFYAKANGRTVIRFLPRTSSGVIANVEFTLSGSGSESLISGTATRSIAAVGSGGWYKLTITFTGNATATGEFQVNICESAGTDSYAGDATKGVYLWGAQVSSIGGTVLNETSGSIHRQYASSLVSKANNAARFEVGVDGQSGAKGILLEGQATNLYGNSLDMTGVSGVRTNVDSNAAVGPTGGLTADALRLNDTNANTHYREYSFTAAASTTYTFSVYLKSAGLRHAAIRSNNLFSTEYVYFNLNNGTVEGSPSMSNSMTSVGNGFYRCSVTATTTGSGAASFVIYITDSASSTIVATGDSYRAILGQAIQIEAGSHPSSFIETSGGATATRAVDSLSVATADIGYTGGDFSLVFETPAGTGQGNYPMLFEMGVAGTTTNRLQLYKSNSAASASDRWYVYQNSTGIGYVTGSAGSSKVAISYANSDLAIDSDTGTLFTDTSQVVPLVDQIAIGSNDTFGSNHLNGHVKRVALYNEALSDTNLQALTS